MGWFRDRWEEAEGFGEAFARRKILRRLSEEAARLLREFTPAGLEHFISSGLSLVDELARTIPPEKQRRYARQAQDYREIAATISDADVLAELARRIPEHVTVLRRHPTWSCAELARIRLALFPVEVIRTRVVALGPGRQE